MGSFGQLLDQLRKTARTHPEGSSTMTRLEVEVCHIGKEVVEETAEVWTAAGHEGTDDTALEVSQLLYHLQVMMIALDLNFEGVYRHL